MNMPALNVASGVDVPLERAQFYGSEDLLTEDCRSENLRRLLEELEKIIDDSEYPPSINDVRKLARLAELEYETCKSGESGGRLWGSDHNNVLLHLLDNLPFISTAFSQSESQKLMTLTIGYFICAIALIDAPHLNNATMDTSCRILHLLPRPLRIKLLLQIFTLIRDLGEIRGPNAQVKIFHNLLPSGTELDVGSRRLVIPTLTLASLYDTQRLQVWLCSLLLRDFSTEKNPLFHPESTPILVLVSSLLQQLETGSLPVKAAATVLLQLMIQRGIFCEMFTRFAVDHVLGAIVYMLQKRKCGGEGSEDMAVAGLEGVLDALATKFLDTQSSGGKSTLLRHLSADLVLQWAHRFAALVFDRGLDTLSPDLQAASERLLCSVFRLFSLVKQSAAILPKAVELFARIIDVSSCGLVQCKNLSHMITGIIEAIVVHEEASEGRKCGEILENQLKEAFCRLPSSNRNFMIMKELNLCTRGILGSLKTKTLDEDRVPYAELLEKVSELLTGPEDRLINSLHESLNAKEIADAVLCLENVGLMLVGYELGVDWSEEQQNYFFSLLCLPWDSNNQNARFLPLQQHAQVLQRKELKIASLRYIGFFPSSYSHKVKNVFSRAMNNEDPEVVEAGLKFLPTWVHKTSARINTWDKDLWLLISQGKDLYLNSILQTLSLCLCSCSKATKLEFDDQYLQYHACILCEEKRCDELKCFPHDRNFIKKVLDLIWRAKKEILPIESKIGISRLLLSVLCHMSEGSKSEGFDQLIGASFWLIDDPCYYVREAFCDCLEALAALRTAARFEPVILEALERLSPGGDDTKIDSLATFLGVLAKRTPSQSLLRFVLGKLLLLAVFEDGDLDTCQAQIEAAATARALTPIQFYRRHYVALSWLWTRQVIVSLRGSDPGDGPTAKTTVVSAIERAARLFSMEIKEWLKISLGRVIGSIAKSHGERELASRVFQALVEEAGKSRKQLVQEHIPIILLSILSDRSSQSQEMLKFILAEGQWDQKSGNLMAWTGLKCKEELALYVGVDPDGRIKSAIDSIDNLSGTRAAEGPKGQGLGTLLHDRPLATLMRFQQLFCDEEPIDEKEKAVDSLILILDMMEKPDLNSIRFKALGVLRAASLVPELRPKMAKAWLAFIRRVPDLTGLLPQLVVSAVPSLERTDLQKLFICITNDRRNDLPSGKEVADIFFLLPSLSAEMGDLLLPTNRVSSGLPPECTDPAEMLHSCLRLLAFEQLYVKRVTLKKLLQVLREEYGSVYSLIINSTQMDPVITDLAQALLRILQSSCDSSEVRILAAECMGELGAVDPGRLGLELSAPTFPGRTPIDRRPQALHFPKFKENGCSIRFVAMLLEKLAKALLATEKPYSYDLCSYAIQNILKALDVPWKKNQKLGELVSHHLSESVRNLIAPLLKSRYAAHAHNDHQSFKRPIISNTAEFEEWIFKWVLLACKDIQNRLGSQLFTACSIWAELDSTFAQQILPFIILQGLLEGNGSNCSKDTRHEVMAVFNSWHSDEVKLQFRRRATQTVFFTLDTIREWLTVAEGKPAAERSEEDGLEMMRVREFLTDIPDPVLAKTAESSKAYTRALMNYELQLPGISAPEQFSKIQELYSHLGHSDGVFGALRKIESLRKPSCHEWIRLYHSTGDYTSALPFHESSAKTTTGPIERVASQIAHVQCLLKINQAELAASYVAGIAERDVSERERSRLESLQAEAAWKLQDWNSVEKIVTVSKSRNSEWNLTLGRLLVAFRIGEWERLGSLITQAQEAVSESLISVDMGPGNYENAYSFVSKLHVLAEVAQAAQFRQDRTGRGRDRFDTESLLHKWEQRGNVVQPSSNLLEGILEVRRHLLNLSPRNPALLEYTQKCWLKSATVARKAGHLQTAWSFLVKAKNECPDVNLPDIFMEEAKFYKAKNSSEEALRALNCGITQRFNGPIENLNQNEKIAYSHALVLQAGYSEQAGALLGKDIFLLYKSAGSAFKDWEQYHYRFACFVERLAENELSMKGPNPEATSSKLFWVQTLIEEYGMSLKLGTRYLRHSMPRILTLWLNFGEEVERECALQTKSADGTTRRRSDEKTRQEKSDKIRHPLVKINAVVSGFFQELPPYIFYVVFSQIISRVAHPSDLVYQVLEDIIVTLTDTFPDQCLWLSIGAYRCTPNNVGARRSERIKTLQDALRKKTPRLKQKLMDIHELSTLLMKLANSRPPKDGRTPRNTIPLEKRLLEFFAPGKDRNVIIPLQSVMEFSKIQPVAQSQAPATEFMDSQDYQMRVICTSPASKPPLYITGFHPEAVVLPSLAKPKKIVMRGSDGNGYTMMCKPQDDMRKDKRLMEFVLVVNSCLGREVESRKRQLHVRTYTVTPLGEDGGLVEWVSNLQSFRSCLERTAARKERRPIPDADFLRSVSWNADDPVDKKVKGFRKTLKAVPEVYLGQWFRNTFREPNGWYYARMAFTRTAAVMSMVGYILGLGDRHSENILIDETCGDVFHVDFNLLFNQGETLPVKEVVPFRLTRNMLDGFGPLGIEGTFRRSCEVTMAVLRENRQMLLSVLDTFVHDPLVAWTQTKKRSQQFSQGGFTSDKFAQSKESANKVVESVDKRLKGMIYSLYDEIGANTSQKNKVKFMMQRLPLSAEGQADKLISQATDVTLLAQMYSGWMPYL